MENKDDLLTLTEYQKKAHTTAEYPDMFKFFSNLFKLKVEGREPVSIGVLHDSVIVEEQDLRNPYYAALGLAGEVGEFCNKLKKIMRDKKGKIDYEFRQQAQDELGDVLWYVAELATSLDLSLENIACVNIEKLTSRKERGKIQGSGDNR